MKRFILIAVLAGLVSCGSHASAQKPMDPAERLENSPRHHEWEDIDAPGDRTVRTWVVFPEVDKPATVVIVIHENRGLTDWVRSVADQLAEVGYVAVAPDLLSGTAPGGGNTDDYESEDAARTGIGKLPPEQVISDLDAVYEYAKQMSAGNGIVAVCGFCWGGGKTFEYAMHNPNIAAAFVFYGSAPRDEDAYKKLEVPVYGFYGGNDFRITGEVPEVQKRMEQLDKTFEPVVYDSAGHGFMRQGEMPNASNADRIAREEAWQRWKKILGELKPKE